MIEELPTCDWCAMDLEERFEEFFVGGDRICEACMMAYWWARLEPENWGLKPAQEDSPPQT